MKQPHAPPGLVLVVGCPRSGSSWLTYLLAQHPQIAAFQHAKLFEYLAHMKTWWRNRTGRSLLKVPALGEAPAPATQRPLLTEEQADRLCRSFVDGVLCDVVGSRPGASMVVDQTPESVFFADFVLRLLPQTRFLHVLRDPRSVFASMRVAAPWAPWEFPVHPADAGRFWIRAVEAGLGIGERTRLCRVVRYEDLRMRGPAELDDILAWLGLPAPAGFSAAAVENCGIEEMRNVREEPGFIRRGEAESWREELTPRDVQVVEYVAGDLMERLGYARSNPSLQRLPIGVRLRDATGRAALKLDRLLKQLGRALVRRAVGRQMPWHWPDP